MKNIQQLESDLNQEQFDIVECLPAMKTYFEARAEFILKYRQYLPDQNETIAL